MSVFPSLDSDACVPQIYKAHPQIYRPWIKMGEEVMSKEAPLSQDERELIATYVSALNECSFCRASHRPSMQLHGIEPKLADALLDEIESAPVDERLKPVLAFAKKLTLAPADLSQADADAVYAADGTRALCTR